MTKDEIREIAHEAAEHAVQEVFVRYGIDATHPIEVQKDFAYLRSARKASESVGPTVKRALIGLFVTGALALLVIGFQSWIGKPPTPPH